MSTHARIRGLTEGLLAGRGVLVLGPAFGHGSTLPTLPALADTLRDALSPEPPHWELLGPDEKLTLAHHALGPEALLARLRAALPGVDAARAEVRPAHRAAIQLPFPLVVDTRLDPLVPATLADARIPWRPLPTEGSPTVGGARWLFRLRGDLHQETPALTLAEVVARRAKEPARWAQLRRLAREGPVLFLGFAPHDPLVTDLWAALTDAPEGGWLASFEAGDAWRAVWASRGVELLSGPAGDLSGLVDRLSRLLPDLAPVQAAEREVGAALAARAGQVSPALGWLSPDAPAGAVAAGIAEPAARAALRSLVARGWRLPCGTLAEAAEALSERRADRADARWIADAGLDALAAEAPVDAAPWATLGRALIRLEAPTEAEPLMERALLAAVAEGDSWAAADALAWLCRLALVRVDALRGAGASRAATEALAGLLTRHASHLWLADRDPGDDAARRAVVYRINLRLGRLLTAASELAHASGAVYASEAVGRLRRAVALDPEDPRAWRLLRALLTGPRAPVGDWPAMLATAPAEVQRRLA